MSFRNTLRSLISGDKRRIVTPAGTNLDATYVTDRFVVLASPAKGVFSAWRNRLDDVFQFLETNHHNHYLIFNLSKGDKPSSDLDRLFLGKVLRFGGWPRNYAPPLKLLFEIVQAIDNWLSRDPRNVAVIQTSEGRGRAGVVICSYMLQKGLARNADDALRFYAQQRSTKLEGVNTPSQIRYVQYMGLVNSVPPSVRRVITKLVMRPVPAYNEGFAPVVEILDANGFPPRPLKSVNPLRRFDKFEREVVVEVDCDVEGDVILQVSNRLHILGKDTTLFTYRLAFHTYFVQNGLLTFGTPSLDSFTSGPLHNDRLLPGFTVYVVFSDYVPLPGQQPVYSVAQQPVYQNVQQPVSYSQPGQQAPLQPSFPSVTNATPYPRSPVIHHRSTAPAATYQATSTQYQTSLDQQRQQQQTNLVPQVTTPASNVPIYVDSSRTQTATTNFVHPSTPPSSSYVTQMPFDQRTSGMGPVNLSTGASPVANPAANANLNMATSAVSQAAARLVEASKSAKSPLLGAPPSLATSRPPSGTTVTTTTTTYVDGQNPAHLGQG